MSGKVEAKRSTREERVIKALLRGGKLKTSEAVALLGTSESTARRLFADMEKRGEVVRVHGGVRAVNRRQESYSFDSLQFQQSDKKQRIGRFGSSLVRNGENIFLDTGTTIQQMALYLVERFKRGELQELQVYTNSLRNLNILMNYCEVNLVGGSFRNKRQDFYGYLSEVVLGLLSFDKCFLSADGVSLDDDSVTASDIYTAKIDQIVTKRSTAAYLLADSTKFSHRSFIQYASISALNMLITDSNLNAQIAERLTAQGVSLELV